MIHLQLNLLKEWFLKVGTSLLYLLTKNHWTGKTFVYEVQRVPVNLTITKCLLTWLFKDHSTNLVRNLELFNFLTVSYNKDESQIEKVF